MTRASAAGAIIEAAMDTPEPAGSQDDHPAASSASIWTQDEHTRFVGALEQLYCGNESIQAAWSSITAAVQTRTITEVKQHASEYLFRLQALDDWPIGLQATVSAIAEPDVMTRADWTREENTLLEDLLAVYSLPTASATYYPWALIAQRIPNKTQQDVQEQYELLCRDIERMDPSGLWRLSQPPPAQLRIEMQPSPTSIFSQCFPSPIATLSPFPSESAFERPWIVDRPQPYSLGQHTMTSDPQLSQTAGFPMRNVLLISALPTPKGAAVSPLCHEPAF